jgi:DNA-binding CsgD family transcriptional regulator
MGFLFKFISGLCLLFYVFCSSAQSPADSLFEAAKKITSDSSKVYAYNHIFKELLYTDRTAASIAADSMLVIAERSHNKKLLALATNRSGSIAFLNANYNQALSLYQRSFSLYQEQNNEREASGLLINIANCYGELGDVEQCLATHLKSLSIQERLGITGYPLATNLTNIAVLHTDLNDPKTALLWGRRARKIFEELKDSLSLAEVDFNIALNLFDVDSVEASQKILDRLEDYHRKTDNPYMLTDVLFESGKNQYIQGRLELSEKYLLEGLKIAESHDDQDVYGIAYNKLFELYMAKKAFEKAEKYALLSYQTTKDQGKSLELLVDLENLADMYEYFGEHKKSVAYHKAYKTLNDSIVGIEKLNAISELKTKYETEKHEQEIVLLKEKEKRSRLEKKALLSGIGGLLLFFFGLVYLLKQRVARAKLEKEKSQQELAFNKKELELKNKELVAYTLQLAHKNEFLENIKNDVIDLERIKNDGKSRQQIVNAININQNDSLSWEGFKKRFQAVHKNFETNALTRYPRLTTNDLRLMSLLKMNLSSKEIANMLNISPDGIKKARYRLRKKLALNSEDSLEALVMKL